jgi:hypothetical protein
MVSGTVRRSREISRSTPLNCDVVTSLSEHERLADSVEINVSNDDVLTVCEENADMIVAGPSGVRAVCELQVLDYLILGAVESNDRVLLRTI